MTRDGESRVGWNYAEEEGFGVMAVLLEHVYGKIAGDVEREFGVGKLAWEREWIDRHGGGGGVVGRGCLGLSVASEIM